MKPGLYMLGADKEPTPVKIVEQKTSLWQSIAIAIGAAASVATLYSVVAHNKRRR